MERQLNLLRQSMQTPKSPPMLTSMGHMITTPHPSFRLVWRPSFMISPIGARPRPTLLKRLDHRHINRALPIWSPTTRSTRIAATVFFKHKYLTNPSVTPTDALIAAAANLAHIIKHNAKAQHVGTKNLKTSNASNNFSRTRSITHETMLHFLATHHIGITAAKATQRRYPPDMLHAVLNDETGELMEYRHLIANPKYRDTWQNAYGKELGRLAQGLPGIVKGTDTIAFIQRSHVPQDRWKDVTYGRIVANFRPEKEDPYRIRLTVGGNRINYPGDCGTPTADMITVKILLNSVISTLSAKFMTIDIKDFYLNTPMARPEYMRLKLADIPAAIIDLYKLRDIAQDGYVFVRIQKAGIIAQQLLEQRLQASGYHQSKLNPVSGLTIGDPSALPSVGTTATVPSASPCQATAKSRTTFPSLSAYQTTTPTLSQRSTHLGSKQQLCATADTSPALGKQQKTFVQEVIGVFLYYARAVDCTMLTSLGSLATQQAKPTTTTLDRVYQFLDYALSHPKRRRHVSSK
eukprot:CCRYP_002932-RA/>CCRYP_002932-RA protein AED:0.32 eAED:0.32 QI:0/0/0/1/0.25/0/5/0/519